MTRVSVLRHLFENPVLFFVVLVVLALLWAVFFGPIRDWMDPGWQERIEAKKDARGDRWMVKAYWKGQLTDPEVIQDLKDRNLI
jgi:hypothetical protein